eukprot:PITA_02033
MDSSYFTESNLVDKLAKTDESAKKCDRAFQDLKKLVSTAPVLCRPNWNLPFQISSDASDTTIGVVLGPGKENPIADFLSRIPKPVDEIAVEDQFPDEHLFAVTFKTPWYANVANYLAVASGPQFAGNKIAATLKNYHIPHKITTPYHPQANGQVESKNKIIEAILTKAIASHRRDWVARLTEALWAYRTTWRSTTGYSPYQLVFGKKPIFPIEFEIRTLRTSQEFDLDINKAQINRLQQINKLDEIRLSALQHTALIQQQRAKWHDALIKNKVFREGDWALLYDSGFQDFPGKLQTR